MHECGSPVENQSSGCISARLPRRLGTDRMKPWCSFFFFFLFNFVRERAKERTSILTLDESLMTTLLCFREKASADGAKTKTKRDSEYQAHRRLAVLQTVDKTYVPAVYDAGVITLPL